MNPKLSVITIAYNNKEGLEKTIKSVIAQTSKDFEYIIIDGNSDDGSKEILKQYSNKIDYWISEPDNGIYNAMNKGIRASNGEYLIFLNSGDEFYTSLSLENAFPYLSEKDIIYGDLQISNDQDIYVKKYSDALSFHYFYIESLPHPSSFIKRTAFEKVGLYNEFSKIVADWEWFLDAIVFKQCSFKHIPIIISTFYLDGISSINNTEVQKERNKVLDKYFYIVKDMIQIEELRKKTTSLEHRYNHLKQYRLIKLLAALKLITIREK